MKRTISLLFAALFLASALLTVGCELPEDPFPEETEVDSSILIDPAKTQPETETETLSPEEEALVEIAAKALWAAYDLPDATHFRVRVYPHASNGSNRVEFTLYIGDYQTNEDYSVRISAEGEVTDISGGYQNYRQFLNGATPEKLAAAEAALNGQLAAYGEQHSGGYLTVDQEGWLCLSCEIIVELETHFWQQEGGCGVDHNHVFINERICPPQ